LLKVALGVCLFLAPGGVCAEEDWVREINRRMRPYTKLLSKVDRVELETLEPWSHGINPVVIETKKIEGEAAQRIADVWRKQNWNYKFSAACHEPSHAIKFIYGERVVLYASVCWECSNIKISRPVTNSQGFDPDTDSARQLLKIFSEAFPAKKQ
jgi:hypothetical protein